MSKKIFFIILGIVVGVIIFYWVIFGRALRQSENHLAIALALPRVIFNGEAVMVDEQTFLSRNTISFIKNMKDLGFTYVEQMGSGYIFEKEGKTFISVGRMYSSHFMIFSFPK